VALDYKNIGKLFSLNIINIVLNFAYSTLMIYLFGTSREIEAFFAASVLGTAVSRFVQTGQLVEIIVPKYHKVKSEIGNQEAMSIISMMANYMSGIAFLLVLIFIAGGTTVVNWLVPGFEKTAQDHVYQIFCITGFLMPIQIATNLFQGMLNAENIYGKVELTNTVSLLVNLLILIIWGHSHTADILVVGLVFSVIMQFLTTLYYLRQVGYKHSFAFKSQYLPFKEMWQAISAATFYMGGVQVYMFAFNAALSFLPAGVFATYRYVEVIYGKVANVFMMPISTVFFNEINRFLNQQNSSKIKAFVTQNLNFSYFIGFMIFIPFLAGGQYLIWTAWGGTKFDANAAQRVYELLTIFFLGMLLTGPYMIFRKMSVSVTRPDLQYYFWGITHVVSGLISYLLLQHFGFKGLLAQIIIHNLITTSVPILTVYFLKKQYFALYSISEVFKITTALLLSLVVVWLMKSYFEDFRHTTKLISAEIGLFEAGISATTFIVLCYFLRVEEIQVLKAKLHQSLRRFAIFR
jgi:putative peptidoglycan lipid II flippase